MNLSNGKMSNTVSVVIPAYNVREHISRALDSVLGQTRPADEIIVVDDGSTDETEKVVQQYGDRVRLLCQENAGAAVARNTGIKAAKCEWVVFLDADDEWLPEKLELQIEILKRNKDLIWVFSDMYNCYCGNEPQKSAHNLIKVKTILSGKEYFESYFNCFLEGFYASTITLIIKREVLEQIGPFETKILRGQDTDLWFRIAYRYPKIGYVPQPLAIYHRGVANSITKTYAHSRVIGDLVERHLQLSAEQGRLEKFQPCGSKMIQVLIREILFEGRMDEIAELTERFAAILPFRFKAEMRLRVRHPRWATLCLGLSTRIKGLFR